MKKLLFALCTILLFSSQVFAQRIAVLEFKAGTGVSQSDVDGLSAIFISYFRPSGYTLVERTQIDKVIDEQNFQRSRLTEDQMVRIGRILNLSKIVVGDIYVVMGQYNVDARVINVESGTISASEGATFTGTNSYRSTMQAIATKLASRIAITPPTATTGPAPAPANPAATPQQTTPYVVMGYLKVFPKDIGKYSAEPTTVIAQINKAAQYNYDTWRLPTRWELSLIQANISLQHSFEDYAFDTHAQGYVLLVTDKGTAAEEKRIAEEKAADEKAAEAKRIAEYERLHGVDLGLSVRWATCNVGASKPEEYGRYFAWGDVSGQTWNGSWSGGGFSSYPRYELSNDNLNPEYDAAHVNLGGKWRMPTRGEFEELINNCKVVWTTINGVKGRLFTSKKSGFENKSIFLPAAGFGNNSSLNNAGSKGYYWSSTFDNGRSAWNLYFSSDRVYTDNYLRFFGRSVRPVSEY